MYLALTNDLCKQPLVFASGHTLEEFKEQLFQWAYCGEEDEPLQEAWQLLAENIRAAKPPNDGLLGVHVSEPIKLECLRLTMWVQCDPEDCNI